MSEWWKGAVIYQIYPRSFQDSNDDGIGDLKGITSRLDYVASLGVDAIWLSPFFKSPMHDFGYDVSDYLDVDPIFGTLADFDALIARAHELGLKVIIDQVLSHTSNDHAWFLESRESRDNPKADWYVWADPRPDGSPPTNWQSVFMGPSWTWDARRGQYYLHNFLSTQPDLNLHNPEVQQAQIDNTRFWLERGVDGFRLDAINFAMHDPQLRDNPVRIGGERTRPFDFQDHLYNQSHSDIPAFLERVRALTDEYPGRFTVAEVGGDDPLPEMKLFTANRRRLDSAYSFTFLYAEKITPALVRKALEAWPEDEGRTGWPSWAFSNHDAPRAISRWASNPDDPHSAKMLLTLLFSLRGNAFLYQGEELGLPQADIPRERLVDPEAIANWPKTLGRDGARTPLPWASSRGHCGFSDATPWLPIDPRHNRLTVDLQDSDGHSTLNWVRGMLDMRRRSAALRTGTIHFHDVPDPLLAFERRAGDERILCVFNLGNEGVAWSPPPSQIWTPFVTLALDDSAEGLPAEVPAQGGYLARLA